MNEILLNGIYFLVAYIIIFLIYVLVINRKKKTYKETKENIEVQYLVKKFNLDKRKIKYSTLKWYINVVNPLIIATTFVIVTNIESLLWGILIGFVVMMALIYSVYELLGRILKKRGSKDV